MEEKTGKRKTKMKKERRKKKWEENTYFILPAQRKAVNTKIDQETDADMISLCLKDFNSNTLGASSTACIIYRPKSN